MRRALLFALLPVFFLAASQFALADEFSLKQSKPGEWQILSSTGQPRGTLRSIEEGAFTVQLNSGEYLGVILKTGELRKPGRRPAFSPEEAQYYLDILQAIRKMK